jgi:hypothetical protein
MPSAPTSGKYARIDIGSTIAPAVNWKLDITGKTADYSNFRDGRVRAAGLPDVTADFEIVWDQGDSPTKSSGLNLRVNQFVTLKCYVDGADGQASSKYWQVPGIVDKLGPASQVDGDVVKMPVTVLLSETPTTKFAYPE